MLRKSSKSFTDDEIKSKKKELSFLID